MPIPASRISLVELDHPLAAGSPGRRCGGSSGRYGASGRSPSSRPSRPCGTWPGPGRDRRARRPSPRGGACAGRSSTIRVIPVIIVFVVIRPWCGMVTLLMMTPSVRTLSRSSLSRAFFSASREVLSPWTTRTMPSTLAPRTSASEISSMGGRSKRMKSHSSLIIRMNRVIFSEPRSSAGLGGMGPALTRKRLGISVDLMTSLISHGIRQIGRQPEGVLDLEEAVLARPPQVGVDDEHGLPRLGQGDGQVGHRNGLPLPRHGRGHGDGLDGIVGRGQEERRADGPVAFGQPRVREEVRHELDRPGALGLLDLGDEGRRRHSLRRAAAVSAAAPAPAGPAPCRPSASARSCRPCSRPPG